MHSQLIAFVISTLALSSVSAYPNANQRVSVGAIDSDSLQAIKRHALHNAPVLERGLGEDAIPVNMFVTRAAAPAVDHADEAERHEGLEKSHNTLDDHYTPINSKVADKHMHASIAHGAAKGAHQLAEANPGNKELANIAKQKSKEASRKSQEAFTAAAKAEKKIQKGKH